MLSISETRVLQFIRFRELSITFDVCILGTRVYSVYCAYDFPEIIDTDCSEIAGNSTQRFSSKTDAKVIAGNVCLCVNGSKIYTRYSSISGQYALWNS